MQRLQGLHSGEEDHVAATRTRLAGVECTVLTRYALVYLEVIPTTAPGTGAAGIDLQSSHGWGMQF